MSVQKRKVDVGVIATERVGTFMYVNGGMKPRHAELLASDLDKETLIRYIDRFFMFYIQGRPFTTYQCMA